MNFHMFKLDLEKPEEPEIKLPTSAGSSKKQENTRKTSTSALLTRPKPLTLWITTVENSSRDGNTRPPYLPPVVDLIYWSFRVMVGLGGFLFILMLVVLWAEYKKRLTNMKWLLWVALFSIPLVYLAGQAGWIVAEVGRQPWVIEGLLPVKAAVSSVNVGAVQTTFFLFVAIFTLFLVIEMRILIKAIKKGPNIETTK